MSDLMPVDEETYKYVVQKIGDGDLSPQPATCRARGVSHSGFLLGGRVNLVSVHIATGTVLMKGSCNPKWVCGQLYIDVQEYIDVVEFDADDTNPDWECYIHRKIADILVANIRKDEARTTQVWPELDFDYDPDVDPNHP